ncbi:uncharacterized protein P884DRAFT_276137 [Thermothelomyces heterothallicus CBS 202.75]|uniref:uncharacterized protein n=1 Tax=Thermothelomyces heterothallicus CBS 202.75 TaxID=1149848 RepID=UPI0037425D6D
MGKQGHIERTAHEPRDTSLHTLTISRITQFSPTVRIFRLAIPPDDNITFLPGQWVDLYPPPEAGVAKPGGFTITSSPSAASPRRRHTPDPSHDPNHPVQSQVENVEEDAKEGDEGEEKGEASAYIELAIQHSPQNPVAAYLFLPCTRLLHSPVRVRVGGSFVFPPALPPPLLSSLRKAVFVAGGMGINPLVSMLVWIGEQAAAAGGGSRWADLEVEVLYSARDPRGGEEEQDSGAVSGSGILFLERVARLFRSGRVKGRLKLFLTGGVFAGSGAQEAERQGVVSCNGGAYLVPFSRKRMTVRDVQEAVGKNKGATVIYICGVPRMTDDFVEALVSPEGFGMDQKRVLFEKWW